MKRTVLPDRIGRYAVERLLGAGSFATVWLAVDETLDARVAIKVLAENWAHDLDVRSRFINEARILWRADHDRIVRVHAVDELDDGRPFFVMAWADRGSLAERIQARLGAGGFALAEAVDIGCEIAECLDVVHQLGVVHRDVKPSNVLFRTMVHHHRGPPRRPGQLDELEQTMLADFGLAKHLAQASGVSLGAGTPAYMAPEQSRWGGIDERVDVFALAVIVYEMLAGATPSAHPSFPRLLPLAELRPDIPGPVQAVLERGLEPDPARRFRHAKELADALRDAATGGPAGASPTAPRVEPARARAPLPAVLQQARRKAFVGRAAERGVLLRRLALARTGELRVLTISGEPGIGKTRLAAEVAAVAYAQGATVLYGRCQEGLALPYGPVVEALRQLFMSGRRGLSSHLESAGPELARLLPGLTDDPVRPIRPASSVVAAEADLERFRLFEAVSSFLVAVSAENPVVLVLDDLQWASTPTLLLVKHVVASSVPMALLLIGIYREGEPGIDGALANVVADLHREKELDRIALRGLTEAEVASLVDAPDGGGSAGFAGGSLARVLWRETQGNPFFVGELLRHLAETEAEAGADAGEPTDPEDADGRLARAGVPDSVRDVVARRIGRLSTPCQRLLRTAAVLGQDFDLLLLGRVTGLAEDEALDVVEEAMAASLLVEGGSPGRHAFAHGLVRAEAYASIGVSRRAGLHHRAALALEAIGAGRRPERLAELARHWRLAQHADSPARVAIYARMAGQQALATLAFEPAALHLADALAALDAASQSPADLRCDLLLDLAAAQRATGDAGYSATAAQAAIVAREVGDPVRLARAALSTSRPSSWFVEVGRVDHRFVALIEEALAGLTGADTTWRALLGAQLAAELYWTPSRQRRRDLCDEAEAIVRRLGDRVGLVQVLASRALALWDPTTLDERLALTSEIQHLAGGLGTHEALFQAHLFRTVALVEQGETGDARRELAAAAGLADELRQPFHHWLTGTIDAMMAVLEAAPDAESKIYETFRIGQRSGQPDAGLIMSIQVFLLRWDQGRVPEIVEALAAMAEQMPAIPSIRAVLCMAYCELARPADAEVQLRQLTTAGYYLPMDFAWSGGMTMLGEACAVRRDSVGARAVYDQLAPFGHRVVVVGNGDCCLGSTWRVLALLAETMGAGELAEQHFESALDVNTRIGARTFLVRTQRAFASMLLDRGRPGDVERAAGLVHEASASASGLGMAVEVERLRALAAEVSRRMADNNSPGRLDPRSAPASPPAATAGPRPSAT